MLHVGVERVAECDHLDQGRKKHEEKRHRVAPDHDEFFKENCAKSAKKFVLHHAAFCCSAACFAESSTNTSSRDGPISRISAWPMPALRSFSSISARLTLSSTSKCID